jgi:hypothetical protein
VRARVLPSLAGKDLSNYAQLFAGVVVYAWQWLALALALMGLLGLAGVWLAVQRNGGVPTLGHRRARVGSPGSSGSGRSASSPSCARSNSRGRPSPRSSSSGSGTPS